MSRKIFCVRFLFFFIIYIGINLLIIKIKSDYLYDNVMNVLNKHKLSLQTVRSKNVTVDEKNVETVVPKKTMATTTLSTTIMTVFYDLKDNHKTVKLISDTCKENNLTTSIIKRNFLYSSKHNGLYCWIRKAGSTSFTKLFSVMNNRGVSGNYYREVNFLTPKTQESLSNLVKDENTFKLLIVRHPFERLVSAYRDRIEDNTKYTAQSWIYAPKIFHLTRPEIFESSGTLDTSLFKIFHDNKRLKLIPTFKEFIKWLLLQNSAEDDPHWNQYYRHCALCSIQYDYVLKLDNYTKSDIDYIFNRMHLDENKIYLSRLERTKKGPTNFDETCNYFKNLSHEAVVNLYEKYRIDFDMFNYEFDKYFECIEGD